MWLVGVKRPMEKHKICKVTRHIEHAQETTTQQEMPSLQAAMEQKSNAMTISNEIENSNRNNLTTQICGYLIKKKETNDYVTTK